MCSLKLLEKLSGNELQSLVLLSTSDNHVHLGEAMI